MTVEFMASSPRDRPVRVLVVDDAAFMVKAVGEILNADPDIEVVGDARNGKEALEKIALLQPDVITLDIDMPVMDGIKAMRHIMIESPVPIVVLSSLFRDGAITFEALRLGIVDFLIKPSGAVSQDIHRAKQRLVDRIKVAAEVNLENVRRVKLARWDTREAITKRYGYRALEYLIAVGTSLGGPNTSLRLFSHLPVDLPAAAILMQEISPQILPSFAKRFDEYVPWKIEAVEDGIVLEPGVCYISSNENSLHLEVNAANEPTLRIDDAVEMPLNQLFTSAADLFGKHTIGVLLTGIGGDGADGFARIREVSGVTIAQEGHSCVYPNLTEYASRAGVVDILVNEKEIAPTIESLIRGDLVKGASGNMESGG
jgi:two-component system, chemotaxis family, protein-glutamate methylesterase/glutaminase